MDEKQGLENSLDRAGSNFIKLFSFLQNICEMSAINQKSAGSVQETNLKIWTAGFRNID